MVKDNYTILVINTGSTSTKIALFQNETQILSQSIQHSAEELSAYDGPLAQVDMRKELVLQFLERAGYVPEDIDVIAARGGSFAVVSGGGYVIDEAVLQIASAPRPGFRVSPSWLAALIAGNLSKELHIPAYFYNAVRTDEMNDIARFSGISMIQRIPGGHPLNTKEVAHREAAAIGQTYETCTFIVAHLGGGISVELHQNGRIVDTIGYTEGAFTPERAGLIPTNELIELCFSGKYTKKELEKFLRGSGGLVDYLGTNDVQKVEQMIAEGNQRAFSVLEAMAYQTAKAIGALAAAAGGNVDAVLLTGGVAYSARVTQWIRERVQFIAPVSVYPGAFEMEALANGILRICRGQESAKHLESSRRDL